MTDGLDTIADLNHFIDSQADWRCDVAPSCLDCPLPVCRYEVEVPGTRATCSRCNRQPIPGRALCAGHLAAFEAAGRLSPGQYIQDGRELPPEQIRAVAYCLAFIPCAPIAEELRTSRAGRRGHGYEALWRITVAREVMGVSSHSEMRRLLLANPDLRTACRLRWADSVPSRVTLRRFEQKIRKAIKTRKDARVAKAAAGEQADEAALLSLGVSYLAGMNFEGPAEDTARLVRETQGACK